MEDPKKTIAPRWVCSECGSPYVDGKESCGCAMFYTFMGRAVAIGGTTLVLTIAAVAITTIIRGN